MTEDQRALVPASVSDQALSLSKTAVGAGLVGADLGLLIFAITESYIAAPSIVLIMLIAAAVLGGLTGVVHALIQRRNNSLNRLNRDLLALQSMAERNLIGEEEYRTLRTRLLNTFEPQANGISSSLRAAVFGGLSGAMLVLVLIGVDASWPMGMLLAALVPGAGLAAVTTGTVFAYRQVQNRLPAGEAHEPLPSGEPVDWEPLGSGGQYTE